MLTLASTSNDPNVVSPGIGGFLAFFFLALALWLLMRNMNGHLRRMSYREAERKAAEEASAQPSSGSEPGPPPQREPGADEPDPDSPPR